LSKITTQEYKSKCIPYQCSNSLQGDFVGPAKVKSVHQTSTPIMHTCGMNKREREREQSIRHMYFCIEYCMHNMLFLIYKNFKELTRENFFFVEAYDYHSV